METMSLIENVALMAPKLHSTRDLTLYQSTDRISIARRRWQTNDPIASIHIFTTGSATKSIAAFGF